MKRMNMKRRVEMMNYSGPGLRLTSFQCDLITGCQNNGWEQCVTVTVELNEKPSTVTR